MAMLPLPLKTNLSFASKNPSIYAKIESDSVFLYSNPKADNESKLFQLPNSYFVRLIENSGEDFYYCAYKDIYGYVRKNEVTAMNGTPVAPFVEASFRVYAPEGLGLYSQPKLSDQFKIQPKPKITDKNTNK